MDDDIELRPEEGAKQAAELMRAVIESITEQSKDQHGVLLTEGRLFFPSGIEAISLKFKVGAAVDIHFQVLGKDAPATDDPETFFEVEDHPGENNPTP